MLITNKALISCDRWQFFERGKQLILSRCYEYKLLNRIKMRTILVKFGDERKIEVFIDGKLEYHQNKEGKTNVIHKKQLDDLILVSGFKNEVCFFNFFHDFKILSK